MVNPADPETTNVPDDPFLEIMDAPAEAPDKVQQENKDTNLEVNEETKREEDNSDYSDNPGEEFSDVERDCEYDELQSIQCHNGKDTRSPILCLCKFKLFFSCGHVSCNIDSPLFSPRMQQNFPTYTDRLVHACSELVSILLAVSVMVLHRGLSCAAMFHHAQFQGLILPGS